MTQRQRQVLVHLGRGLSEKEIARELDISPSRVAQHVRALKDRLGTERRSGLVAAATYLPPYKKPTGQEFPVPGGPVLDHPGAGVVADQVSVSDAMPMRHPAPWESDAYRVGPGAFDGPNGTWVRAAAVVAMSFGIPVLLVLLIMARWAITAAFAPTP